MSHTIVRALSRNENAALSEAIAWLNSCPYSTPTEWIAYSKLMAAVLDYSSECVQDKDIAHAIARYCRASWTNVQTLSQHRPAVLAFYRTFEKWPNISASVWMDLTATALNLTAFYQWSLDNQRFQDQMLNTKYPSELSLELLHTYLARANLKHALAGRPLLLNSSVHWNLWTIFYEESLGVPSSCFSQNVQALSAITPISFEHAITECYQQAPHRFNQKSCRALLEMDFTQGHGLTTCCGVLLLYSRFQSKGQRTLEGVKKRYPGLLEGFEIHLGIYTDIDNALVHADALMDHWHRTVHRNDGLVCIDLPANVLD